MKQYAKALSALAGGVATWGYTATADGVISLQEWFGLFGVVGTALAVFGITNDKSAPTDA